MAQLKVKRFPIDWSVVRTLFKTLFYDFFFFFRSLSRCPFRKFFFPALIPADKSEEQLSIKLLLNKVKDDGCLLGRGF